MTKSYVLTVIGDDRPGIVGELAAVVDDHGGSWLESRMARLAGKFAGIVHVDLPRDRAGAFERALPTLSQGGLTVSATSAADSDEPAPRRHVLSLLGADHPGIVHEVARALARHGVNVEDLVTGLESAPMSGEPMFRATAQLVVPAEVGEDRLREELEELAQGLVVEIRLVESPS